MLPLHRFYLFPGLGRWLLIVAMLAIVAGCDKAVEQKDRAEWADEHMALAQEEARKGRIDEAITLYTETLKSKPDLALGHLELALLLHSYKSDYIGAIYHYRQYLEMSPGSEKAEVVNGRIRTAGQQFAVLVETPDVSVKSGDATSLEKENLALRRAVQVAEEKLTKSRALLRQMQERLEAAEAKSSELSAKQIAMSKAETKRDGKPETTAKPKPQPEPEVPTVKTYEVLRGDTLSKIALKVYKDPGKWRIIFDANKETLGGSELVRPGQILVIP